MQAIRELLYPIGTRLTQRATTFGDNAIADLMELVDKRFLGNMPVVSNLLSALSPTNLWHDPRLPLMRLLGRAKREVDYDLVRDEVLSMQPKVGWSLGTSVHCWST